ncbi:MAG: archaeosortase/exosortase family protein [Isosphaeraceae bacterium]
MRQLTGFLALTAAVAYLTTRPLWYRLAVVAAAVPIAMTANVARVALTGYIMYHVNPQYASGAYHTLEGLLMLGFGLALLRALCWALDQVGELFQPGPPPAKDASPRPNVEAAPRAEPPLLPGPSAAASA